MVYYTVFDSIDWAPLEGYLKSVPTPKLTNLIKLIHGWQFSSSRKALFESSDKPSACDGMCPLLCGEKDHVHHYLRCTKQPDTRQLTRELRSLEQTLEKWNTRPDLKCILLRSMKAYLAGTEPTLDWTPNDDHQEDVKAAFLQQQQIGWDRTFLGHFGQQWRHAQQHWYDRLRDENIRIPKGQNGLTWAKAVIKGSMHLALNRWQIRNEAFHEAKKEDDYTTTRKTLLAEIALKYKGSHPTHPAVERLMRVSQDELTTGPNGHMRTWLHSFDLVMKFLRPSLITSYLG